MSESDIKKRKLVDRIISATRKGDIVWKKGGPLLTGDYFARWRGYSLTARWLRDETSFFMESESKPSDFIHISRLCMDGLQEAILDQVEPYREQLRAQLAKQHERWQQSTAQKESQLLDQLLDTD